MTASKAARPAAGGTASGAADAFVGTGTLVRFMLRRDRIRLPAWTLGISALALYYAAALPTIFPTRAELQGAATFMEGPVGAVFGGPGYGFDNLTIERFLVGQYGLYFLLAAALMSILTVSRHTRVEEQNERTELIRASVVGRHAPLTAALVVTVITNGVLALLVTGAMVVSGFEAGGSMLFGAGIGAAGLAFGGIAAAAVQVTEYSRAASAIAGAFLGVAFTVRAAGDIIGEHGSTLSWLSPLSWSQQTRPFVDGRWWPLALSVAFAVATAAVGYVLSARRDVGASLVPPRPGPAEAAAWLGTPLALAFRLQRASLIGWGVALAAAGLVYGAFTQPLITSFEDMSNELLVVLGGEQDLLGGYLGLMGFAMAVTISVFAVLAVQGVRSEETTGRAEPVLSTAVSRIAWLASNVVVSAIGVLFLLAVAGFTTGIGAAIGTGDWGFVGELTLAHIAHTPAVLTILALAAILYGLAPRMVPVAFAVVVYALAVGFFGPVLDFPNLAYDLSPLEHIAQMPLEDFTVAPVVTLGVIAVAGIAVALAAFRRRDLT